MSVRRLKALAPEVLRPSSTPILIFNVTIYSKNKLQPNSNSLSAPGWDKNYNPWAGVVEVKEETMSDDEEESQSTDKTSTMKTKKHLSKKEKKELDRLEASEIARLEKQVLEGEKAEPVTAAEFDR